MSSKKYYSGDRMLLSTTLKLTALTALLAAPTLRAAPTQWTTDVGGNGHFYDLACCENWSTSLANAGGSSFSGFQGYLATITNAAENEFVTTLAQAARFDIWWLGASDEVNEGLWTWRSGPEAGTNLSFFDWGAFEPNDFLGNEDHLAVQHNSTVGSFWNDANRDIVIPYIVEYGADAGRLVATGDVTDSTFGLFIPPTPPFKIIGSTTTGKIEVFNHHISASIPYAWLGLTPTGNGELLVRDNSDLTIAPVTFANASLVGEDVVETALFVGQAGQGNLTIKEGSTVSGARYVQVGYLPGSTGNASIDGAGSELNISGNVGESYSNFLSGQIVAKNTQGVLGVGLGGEGALSITNGGKVNVTEIASEPVVPGGFGVSVGGSTDISGGNGLLTIDGAGSALNIVGKNPALSVGGVGPDIVAGGGAKIGGTGGITVKNGGALNISSVGDTPNLASVGNGGIGKLNVTGPGSTVNMTGDHSQMYVGIKNPDTLSTHGEIAVTNGGKITLASTGRPGGFNTSFISLGTFTGGDADLRVDGAGSVVDGGDFVGVAVNLTLNDFGQDPFDAIPDQAVGTGTITVTNGGRIETDLGVFIGNGGVLKGDGTVVGSVFASTGGIISPGTSPGDLTVIGGVFLNFGGTLNLEIDSASLFDRILATGPYVLGGGKINFIFGAGVDPLTLELFNIGDFLRAIPAAGDPSTPATPSLDGVLFAGQSNGFDIQSIAFDATTGFQVERTVVPLPGALPLLLGALGALGLRRRVRPAKLESSL